MIRTILILIVLLVTCPAWGTDSYIYMQAVKQPLYSRDGQILPDKTERVFYAKERRRINYGGEWVFPSLESLEVAERYQMGSEVVVRVSYAKADYINALLNKKTVSYVETMQVKVDGKREAVTYKEVPLSTFKVKLMPDKDAVALLESWGFKKQVKVALVESGVTK